jgi:type IV secretory pathway component VirB8
MRSIAQDRLTYLVVRSVSALVQVGALICLTPIKQNDGYVERIIAFVTLSSIAWFLNLCTRRTGEYQRRILARHRRAHRRREFAVSLLATVFAAMAIVYLQIAPTWPIFAISLSLGGCAGYALTNV